MWDGLCRDQQSPKYTAQPQPMRARAALRHPAALPCKEQTSAASTARRTHPPKLWETLRPLFPLTLYKFWFTVKCFSTKAVLSKGRGDAEQQEPWGCSTCLFGGTSSCCVSLLINPYHWWDLFRVDLGQGCHPPLLISATATNHRTFLHLKAKYSVP